MKFHLQKILRALLSPKENEALYRGRGVSLSSIGVRNRVTLAVSAVLTSLLFLFVISLSLKNNSTENYLESRTNIELMDLAKATFYVTAPEANGCTPVETCFEYLAARRLYSFTAADKQLPLPPGYEKMTAGETRKMLMIMSIPLDVSHIEDNSDDLIVRLPRVLYEKADVFVEGKRVLTGLGRDPLVIPVPKRILKTGVLDVNLILDVTLGQDVRLLNFRDDAFVATHYEFKKYSDFMGVRRLNSTSQVGMVARVVLAIFVLLLFMIIESSSEAFGLALFMGFEAWAIILSFMDLKRFLITSDVNLGFLIHYSNAMGDIFRLYFYMQLCRIAKPAPGKWLFWASIYSVIYGLMRHYNVEVFGDPNWARYHIAQRDLLVSTVGIILCVNTIRHLWNRKLPWRIWALSLAAIAATAQWLGAAPLYLSFLRDVGDSIIGYNALISAINTNSAFLFALSTFINISTLENRVKVLSREKARAEALEKELELGRAVQTSFQKVPDLPADLKISIHYEAATFVSGDSYFVHWNESAEFLTFLLNDVTGHGIQAALKAFACNIVARSIWNRPWVRNDRRLEDSLLRKYDLAVTELIHADGDVPDFNAMVGVEFHRAQKLLKIYRVNYSFPVVISPKFDFLKAAHEDGDEHGWAIREISVNNQKVAEIQISEGSFVVLVSDGFAENVRQRKSLIESLEERLKNSTQRLDQQTVLQAALAWETTKTKSSQDDKTVMVFQWNPAAVEGFDGKGKRKKAA